MCLLDQKEIVRDSYNPLDSNAEEDRKEEGRKEEETMAQHSAPLC